MLFGSHQPKGKTMRLIVCLLTFALLATPVAAQNGARIEACKKLLDERIKLNQDTIAWVVEQRENRAISMCDIYKRDVVIEQEDYRLLKRMLGVCPRRFIDDLYPHGAAKQAQKVEQAKRNVADECK